MCLLLLTAEPACADDKPIKWEEVAPNFAIALHQQWGAIKFTAIRFHLGYYDIKLVDVKSYRNEHLVAIRKLNDNRKFSNELLDTGIGMIFKTWPDQSSVLAVAPAGWSTSLTKIEAAGFLKVSGKIKSDFDDRESLSAILCLHSPRAEFHNFEYQVPVFFRTLDETQISKAETCNDAVQVGPRIIEDSIVQKDDQRGIRQEEMKLRPLLRVVFAIDDPGRSFPKGNPNVKLKDNARNAYIVMTENPAHLWNVQEMLLSDDFYGQGVKPRWAVNLAGGGPSGLVVSGGVGEEPKIIGNPSGIIGSAFVITKKSR
jgi:hypothetical protein